MKLQLDKNWYKTRIAQEGDWDVTAGKPAEECEVVEEADRLAASVREDDFGTFHVFGSLIEMLRRDRGLSVEQLAANARVEASELLRIERDPRFVPKPRTVHQLAYYFQLPDRSLMKLSNITAVHSVRLRDAAVRFAANSEPLMELRPEERHALTEFVAVLSSEEAD